ncbi:MAG: hypothetical protein ACR2GH_08745 [Pseudonocardia sp.]
MPPSARRIPLVPELLWPAVAGAGAMARDVDQVELKVIVPVGHHVAMASVLGVDRLEAQIRRVYYLDTSDLALSRRGLVVRARKIRGGVDDLVVKLRRVVPVELPAKTRRSPNLTVEIDALPGSSIWSASLRRSLKPSMVGAAVTGRRPLRTLFSTEQRAFYRAHADNGMDIDKLRVHGPVDVARAQVRTAGFGNKMIVESWVYPDGSRLLELSAKCRPARAERIAAEARSFLNERGVVLTDPQRTKTHVSLEYFTR